eukprot:CAMPEP_0194043680 /NCGR_PEP_ID=MMETSP0009_2-20130614/15269_1 /TAXON_ID=210454 /ORGANISM="Grammatophora oceanica, Strain CCMP 410" /LENGTH=76 /DNA_ID=CAMNT_0038687971 /DNA_START=185 /DNA_END=415 /DNA_ORIENTATION=+
MAALTSDECGPYEGDEELVKWMRLYHFTRHDKELGSGVASAGKSLLPERTKLAVLLRLTSPLRCRLTSGFVLRLAR